MENDSLASKIGKVAVVDGRTCGNRVTEEIHSSSGITCLHVRRACGTFAHMLGWSSAAPSYLILYLLQT